MATSGALAGRSRKHAFQHQAGKLMALNEAKANCETQIRVLLEDWVTAIRAKDVERAVSLYAPDVVSFDLAPPLDYRGTEAIQRSLEEWFQHSSGRLATRFTT